jgi:hypothetical protein
LTSEDIDGRAQMEPRLRLGDLKLQKLEPEGDTVTSVGR